MVDPRRRKKRIEKQTVHSAGPSAPLARRLANPVVPIERHGTPDAERERIMAFKHVLVPIDFDETSDHALEVATDLAHRFGASIKLLHVVDLPPYAYANFGATLPPPEMLGALESHARTALDQALNKVRPIVSASSAVLTTGVPWRQIMTAIAEPGVDLVVMGTQRRRWLEHALLGSVAEKVVRVSPVPVSDGAASACTYSMRLRGSFARSFGSVRSGEKTRTDLTRAGVPGGARRPSRLRSGLA